MTESSNNKPVKMNSKKKIDGAREIERERERESIKD